MPELPEVETIRRDLSRHLVGKKITDVLVRDKKIAPASVVKNLEGNKIIAVERRGKLLAFKLHSGQYLLTHLKMTGQLIYCTKKICVVGGHSLNRADDQSQRFTRVIISFADKSRLLFNDMRRFGYMKIVSAEEKNRIWQKDFGIEPLTPNFKFPDFKKLFAGRKTNLKVLLMNQKLIAGIGNIYADEICFCARVLPWRQVSGLKPEEVKKIFTCATHVLAVAIKNRGTTFKDFVDSSGKQGDHYRFLNVYERDGEKCRRCGAIIKKTRHAGRGTHYCPGCQK